MELSLKDRVVVITGGASGIGLATVRAFAAEGAHVAIWDLNEASGHEARTLGTEFAVKAIGISVNVSIESAVRAAMDETIRVIGPIDHVVHAAAIGSGKFGFPFTNVPPADWPRVLEVNVMGMVNVAHALAPHLAERVGATMVFVASVAGQIGSQTDPPYSASKAANINFAQCMAKDLAPRGVRVNTVCPGMVQTPLNRGVWQAWHDQASPKDRLRTGESITVADYSGSAT